MTPPAFLCAGQGGQHPAMFGPLAQAPEAEPVFAAAASLLGEDPRSLVARPGADLFSGRVAQILCCTQALAGWAALAPARGVLAGYSIGELATWGCAGMFDAPTTLRLAATRAELMQDAAPPGHGLAAILGLDRATLDPLLTAHGAVIAIVNAADHVVIGGADEELAALCEAALARGAGRALRLPVSVPAHTPFLQDAVSPFAAALRAAGPRPPRPGLRLLGGLDGRPVFDLDAGIDALARQLAAPINWAACLDGCAASGATRVLELGPGRALAHMAAPLFPAGAARALEEFRSLAGITGWLAG